ncbi:molybdopterin-dependent oxidoreductase [Kitasatospora sp. NPDC090091]|uniref:molybdopterin-dependent oxidoreductase n=1 Tax=Kitasatospora sp. NPDC090091 TaxID=3364081 RepID=UPI00380BA0F3
MRDRRENSSADRRRRGRGGRGAARPAVCLAAAALVALPLAGCASGSAGSDRSSSAAATPTGTAATSDTSATGTTAAAPTASATPLKPGEVRITGQVDKPYTVTVADVRKLPQVSVPVEFTSAKGPQAHTYEGALLNTVLTAAAPRFDQSKKNPFLRGVVVATGGGDYRAVLAWAELDPGFAKSQVLLAVSEDGKPFDDAAGPRLVVPQDTKGGRYVSELNQLWVGTVDAVVDGAR